MPVHRHVHEKRGSVYAYHAELDAWWQGRRQRLEADQGNGAGIPPEAARDIAIADDAPAAGDRWPRWSAGVVVVLLVIATGALVLRWFPYGATSSSPFGATLVRLTSTSGLNIDPALSADGSLLAFASDRGGTGELDIWVQPVGGGRSSRGESPPCHRLTPSLDGQRHVHG